MGRTQVDGADGAYGAEIELKGRPDAQQNGDSRPHRSGVGSGTGLRLLLLQQLLGLRLQVLGAGLQIVFLHKDLPFLLRRVKVLK